ncbi:MAG TPA: hypothetical protein VHU19_14055 [Pyrinomonadaceae bacterium]|jgi:hypothetical protein|nr:hypothetical protein [Pyrinomonadaceae bacterium]
MAKKNEMPDDLITFQEAADLRGYSDVSAVTRMVARTGMRVYEKYGRKLLSRSEVKSYRPAKGGRPATKKGGRK